MRQSFFWGGAAARQPVIAPPCYHGDAAAATALLPARSGGMGITNPVAKALRAKKEEWGHTSSLPRPSVGIFHRTAKKKLKGRKDCRTTKENCGERGREGGRKEGLYRSPTHFIFSPLLFPSKYRRGADRGPFLEAGRWPSPAVPIFCVPKKPGKKVP